MANVQPENEFVPIALAGDAEILATLDDLYPGALALLLIRVCPPHPHAHRDESCETPGKRALDSDWNARALERFANGGDRDTHLRVILSHLKSGGNLGLAIPTGILALDADSPAAVAFLDRALPEAPMQESRPGHAHFLVAVPHGVEIPARTKVQLSPGVQVDFRPAGRAMIVVEPGIHATGAAYTWKRLLPEKLEEIPPCPPVILEAIIESGRKGRPSEAKSGNGEAAKRKLLEGERNDTLFRDACAMRRRALPESAIRAALDAENMELCEPLLDDNEVNRIAKSAARYAPTGDCAQDAAGESDVGERPIIRLTDRQLDTLADEAIEALLKLNIPPSLFMRSEGVVTIRRDEEGRAIVAEVGETEITERLAGAARWLRETKNGIKNAGPTRTVSGVVRARLIRRRDQFPPLRGVTESPLLRADGSIVSQPGYDPSTRLYYLAPEPLDLSGVPLEPSSTEIEGALSLINEMIADFPFASEADRATAIACYLTLIMREAIAGCVPAFLLDGPVAGTGKGLLADANTAAATGGLGAKTTAPDARGDDEWRKRITAMLLEGRAVCVLDNVEQPIGSAALAAALTTEVWSDRILGSTRMVNIGNRATWLITGNNLRVRGDLPRRCVWCRLDAKLARPWTRTEFRHPALVKWVRENRAELLAAGFTLGRAWFAADRPAPGPEVPLLGSFEAWRHVIGGTLRVAGVKEFLGNLDRLYATIDDDAPAWTAFLSAWDEAYGDSPITVAELIADLDRDDRRDLRDALPDDLATALDAESEGSRRKRFGKGLARKKESRFVVNDETGATLRMVQDDTQTRSKVTRWRVIR